MIINGSITAVGEGQFVQALSKEQLGFVVASMIEVTLEHLSKCFHLRETVFGRAGYKCIEENLVENLGSQIANLLQYASNAQKLDSNDILSEPYNLRKWFSEFPSVQIPYAEKNVCGPIMAQGYSAWEIPTMAEFIVDAYFKE